MRALKLVGIVSFVLLMSGCGFQVQPPNEVNQQVVLIKIVAKNAVYFAGKDKLSESKLKQTIDIIENKVLPVLKGLNTITKAVADELINKIDGNYSVVVNDAILIVQSFITEVPLDQTIGQDNLKRITALFEGILQGSKLLLEK